jgi:protein disulfide-isomerase
MKKTFQTFLLLSVSVLMASTTLVKAESEWLTSHKEALEMAAEENRPILVDFTGSDWCGWCVKLQKDIFTKSEWQDFAKENLVLLELDFPNAKPQSDELKAQNAGLQKKFGVNGFPTLVLLDSKGKEIARNEGYLQGGPQALISWIQKHIK